ncbi:MAG: Sua5/YciO/YrdC/YwlC family protein [Desulfovibrionaceae bacterium]|nr:Sua5/YciO/YrdC/YwlC family protein [Desulfovibrionaceae bacterium]
MRSFPPLLSLVSATKCLAAGGVLCFPTETFYAVGCAACNHKAVALIYKVKHRSFQKPLPLACGSLQQLQAYVEMEELPKALVRLWPGPLTVLVRPKTPFLLAKELLNPLGEIAVRVSASVQVQALAKALDSPITVSSANVSGGAAVHNYQEISKELWQGLLSLDVPIGVLEQNNNVSCYNLPSTIVRIKKVRLRHRATHIIELLRLGAIDFKAVRRLGLPVRLNCLEPQK